MYIICKQYVYIYREKEKKRDIHVRGIQIGIKKGTEIEIGINKGIEIDIGIKQKKRKRDIINIQKVVQDHETDTDTDTDIVEEGIQGMIHHIQGMIQEMVQEMMIQDQVHIIDHVHIHNIHIMDHVQNQKHHKKK